MLIIPAIDLFGGKVVRLVEGRRERATVYSDSPGDVARQFVDAGATRLHVVDLDGAFTGKPENRRALEAILACGASVQVGGGLRELIDCRRLLQAGAARVVVGTLAARDPHAFIATDPSLLAKLIVAVDGRDGKVQVKGWLESTELEAIALARLVRTTVAGVLYTDVGRDGTGRGPDVIGSAAIAAAIRPLELIASGGIGTLAHLRALAEAGVPACVVGRALYDGAFRLAEAQRAGAGS
jgi:phosphoribosylformimino-5-aminoimidazole carboxamide ribotide isomerase